MEEKPKRLVDSDPSENADKFDRAFDRAFREQQNRLWLFLLLVLVVALGGAAYRWLA